MEHSQLRKTFGKFATGITVVTGVDENQKPIGVTVNSFTSVSLTPPLVSFCLDRKNKHFDAFSKGSHFVVNILSANQRPLSDMFAAPLPHDFSQIDHEVTKQQIPKFEGGLGYLNCQIQHQYDGGDHVIFVGEVMAHEAKDGEPLLYFSGSYATL